MISTHKINTSRPHFLNSAIRQPGLFSCPVDCFLEICHDIFLPWLSEIERSEIFEIIYNVSNQYDNIMKTYQHGDNYVATQNLLSDVRESLWSHLRMCCNSLMPMDSNGQFSEIFQWKIL